MRAHLVLLAVAGVAGIGCRRIEPPAPAPPTEFIIAAADSVFWVRSDAEGIRVRSAPMVLAEIGGRFAELYVADDDFSFYDAVFVGQRLYKRDIISGDSTQIFADTLMSALARSYAAANPGERPLDADEQGNEYPRTMATADLLMLDVHGPWLSFEYRTDVDVIGGMSSHTARRGVIDLRTGSRASLEALFGNAPARRVIAQGRARWRAVRDSLATIAADPAAVEAVDLEHLAFDPRSFALEVLDRLPMVRFAVTQAAAEDPTGIVELDPLPVTEPAWWSGLRGSYPVLESGERSGEDRAWERVWAREGFSLVGRIVNAPVARVGFVLRDDAGSEWRLGSLPWPVSRVMWLGDSNEAPGTRQALTKAFNEAATYSENTRIVRYEPRGHRQPPTVRFAARRPLPPLPTRRLSRKRATADAVPATRTSVRQ